MPGPGARRRRRAETLLLPLGTFGLGAGGRTGAALSRAGVLAPDFRRCVVLTFNHRWDYAEIAAAWWARLGLPDDVEHRNLYEWLAGEPVLAPAAAVPFVPAEGLERRRGGQVWLRRDDEGVPVQRFELRADGTLERVRHDVDRVPLRWEEVDRAGRVHSVRHRRDADGVVRVDRLTPAGRVYVTELRREDRVTLQLRRGEGRTETLEHGEAVERWLRALTQEFAPVVHLLDDLRYVTPVLRADPGGRVVATMHSNHTDPGRESVKWYAKLALDHLDEVTVVTPTRQQLRDLQLLYGREAPILLAPHAVALRAARRKARTWLRDLLRRPPTVVVVTRLVPVKRLDHVLRAFAIVRAAMPQARLEVWGEGEEAGALRALSRELGLTGVRFAGHTTDPGAALRRGRVAVSTSSREGFGLSTAEALATGTPVVSYDYRYGPRDLVRPGVDGYLVPDGDVDALAARLLDMLSHPLRARLMGLAATRVRLRFSVRRHRRAWLDAIDRTLLRASAGARAATIATRAPSVSVDTPADPGQELSG